ncbi:ROK family protein [Antrihabitans cavernicola]|uniref:ROK family protein n=1 Tax=Antrihabitans cavernicola TaxID=2495913 RepID=UPI001F40AA3F|nr:ROK family protein [Spelaeibacter cavernicola]
MTNPAGPVLGIDVGGTTVKGEVTAVDGTVLAQSTVATPRGDAAIEAIAELGADLIARSPVERAAVLLPGIVDADRGVAVFSANIGWRDRPVRDLLEARWGIPVVIDHDVATAGWAEWRFGAGRGHDDVCVLIVGTGISGSLAVGGRQVRGGRGQPGEYGHIPVRPDGIACACGNVGCMETVASAAAITREYTRRSGREIDGSAAVFAALETDPVAREVWSDAVEAMADGMIGVIHAVSPELLVLAGGLAGAGSAVTEPLRRALDARLTVVPAPDVVVGKFGARAGLVAAGLLARLGERSDTA